MPARVSHRIATSVVVALSGWFLLIGGNAHADPSDNVNATDEQVSGCTGNPMAVSVPVKDDPTAYENCLYGVSQGIRHCPPGDVFNATVMACTTMPTNGGTPSLSVDALSQDPNNHIINVTVTYSGVAMGDIGVIAQDLSVARNASASATEIGRDAYGKPISVDLINDGQPHTIVFPLPASTGAGLPDWMLQPGEEVTVSAAAYNMEGQPIKAASATRVFTIPGNPMANVPNGTITADSLSIIEQTLNVNITYSGTRIGSASITLHDLVTDQSAEAHTSYVGSSPDGSPLRLDLVADGDPHTLAVPVKSLFGEVPPFPAGDEIRADAFLFDDTGGPIQTANSSRTLTAPSLPPAPAPGICPAGDSGDVQFVADPNQPNAYFRCSGGMSLEHVICRSNEVLKMDTTPPSCVRWRA